MNTLHHPSSVARHGMAQDSNKLWLLPILFFLFAVTSGCNESGLISTSSVLEITSATPAANADSVPVNTSISVTFNESMDSTSINEETFFVKIDTVRISGSLIYSDTMAVFVPSAPLEYESSYSVTVSSDVQGLSGSSLAKNYEWSFSTEEAANSDMLQVISTNPAHNAENVSLNSAIKVSFNKPMNSTSLNTSTFAVYQGSTPISGMVNSASNTATFSPFSVLNSGSTYNVVISSEVENTLGNTMEDDFEWSFKTIIEEEPTPPQIQSVSPPDDERDVPVDVVISASFSKALDPATVNTSTFMITQNGTAVSGSINLSGSTVSFTPNDDLPYEAEVTAVITTGVTDEAGNNLQADYEWSFVVMNEPDAQDNISPEVTSTSPDAGEQDVEVNSVITATFSEPMNGSTITTSTIKVSGGVSVTGSVAYSGNTVTFTPNNDLQENTTHTVTITTGVEDVAGNSLDNDFEWSFTTLEEQDTTPPQIQSVSPSDNENNVAVDVAISASFTKALDPASVNASTVIITQNGNSVSGSIDLSGSTVSFTPDNDLPYEAEVTAVITTGVTDEAGNNLPSDYEWSFVVMDEPDTTPPQIQSVSPSDNENNVAVDVAISASFSKALDPATVNASTVIITQNGNSVSGSIDLSGSTVSFTPDNNLPYEAEVTAVITTGVTDEAGNNLPSDYEWNFVTMDEPDITPPQVQSVSPSDNENNVAVDVAISASFSKALDPATVNASTFTVTQNGTAVSGSINLSGSTVSFTPNGDLPYAAEVTAVITTGVTDEAGNNLPSDYEWSFVVMDEQDITPPQVQSVSPSDNENNVAVDVAISASFSKALDPATVNASTFTVTQNGTAVSGSINLSGSTVSFTPNGDLPYAAEITAVITTGVQDEAGNNLPSDYEWSFVVMDEPDDIDNISPEVISTSPEANEKDVDEDSDITATFSEPMNESTITTSTIIVTIGSDTVPGTLSYSGNTVTFTPDSDLEEKKTYKVTITRGVEDLAGNALESDVVWTFRTENDDDDD